MLKALSGSKGGGTCVLAGMVVGKSRLQRQSLSLPVQPCGKFSSRNQIGTVLLRRAGEEQSNRLRQNHCSALTSLLRIKGIQYYGNSVIMLSTLKV